jgi:hypothetical protein
VAVQKHRDFDVCAGVAHGVVPPVQWRLHARGRPGPRGPGDTSLIGELAGLPTRAGPGARLLAELLDGSLVAGLDLRPQPCRSCGRISAVRTAGGRNGDLVRNIDPSHHGHPRRLSHRGLRRSGHSAPAHITSSPEWAASSAGHLRWTNTSTRALSGDYTPIEGSFSHHPRHIRLTHLTQPVSPWPDRFARFVFGLVEDQVGVFGAPVASPSMSTCGHATAMVVRRK